MNISAIHVYPVKALGGISTTETTVERRGLKFDRRWMIVDSNGVFISQREFAAMAAIEVALSGTELCINAAGFEELRVPTMPRSTERVRISVWRKQCDAVVTTNEADNWFSRVLKTSCRMVYLPDNSDLSVEIPFSPGGDPVSFADGYPLLLTSEKSLADLNLKYGAEIPMNRFRPNLVIAGSQAFAEDRWKRIRIGETVFYVVKPCVRCVVTTIDQQLGVSSGDEPLAALARFRNAEKVFGPSHEKLGIRKNAVVFGENLIPENADCNLSVGDQVEVLEFRD